MIDTMYEHADNGQAYVPIGCDQPVRRPDIFSSFAADVNKKNYIVASYKTIYHIRYNCRYTTSRVVRTNPLSFSLFIYTFAVQGPAYR